MNEFEAKLHSLVTLYGNFRRVASGFAFALVLAVASIGVGREVLAVLAITAAFFSLLAGLFTSFQVKEPEEEEDEQAPRAGAPSDAPPAASAQRAPGK